MLQRDLDRERLRAGPGGPSSVQQELDVTQRSHQVLGCSVVDGFISCKDARICARNKRGVKSGQNVLLESVCGHIVTAEKNGQVGVTCCGVYE